MSDSIIKSLGAGSGIDSSSLVSNLVNIERAPQEERLDSKEATLKAQISAYGTLKSSLTEFQNAMEPLADNDTFNARSVAFPDSDVITPNSVDAGAQTGTYQISVETVAQSQSLAIGAYANFTDKDAALSESGTLTINFGSWAYAVDGADADLNQDPDVFTPNDEHAALNITVETGDSLQEIADKINAEDSDVQASVLLVGSNYQLMLTAPSGKDNALSVETNDASKDSGGLSVFEFSEAYHDQVIETQQAQNALLKVNGLSVSRESNEISDIIQGFNFTINKADPGNNLTFSVTEDTAVAEQAVEDFVEAYNLFYKTAKNLTGISKDEDNNTVKGDLITDGTAKTIINRLRATVTATVSGLDDGFTALTNIGVRTELDGTLSIDDDDFKDAFSNNFDLIEKLFATNTATTDDQVTVKAGSYAADAVAGDYAVVVTTNPEKATVTANAQGLDFGTPPIVLGANYIFKVTVDGTKSDDIQLDGTYSSVEEVRAALQTQINGDSKLKATNAEVDVGYNGTAFTFTSRTYGASSEITFETTDLGAANVAELGLVALTDKGVNAEGTIAGETAFGSGNVLLPPIGSGAYGLNFTIGENAKAAGTVTTTFTRGLAGELSKLIDSFLSSSGSIKNREDNIDDALENVTDDRKELDRKMEKLELRLISQFLAMERIVSSFKGTGNQLDGILDRLPFTATNS